MKRFQQALFMASVLVLSWLAMMAVHELGHASGALESGGSVTRVVRYPLAILRTDLSPNPRRAISTCVVAVVVVIGELVLQHPTILR